MISIIMLFYVLISSATWNMCTCITTGICSRQYREETLGRIFYFNKFFCCGNYEDHNGRCEPCLIGFTSAAESTCVPCPNNTFGIKCSEYCNCKLDQRCDIEIGCVKVEQNTAISSNYTTSVRANEENNVTQTSSLYQQRNTTIAVRHPISQSTENKHTELLTVTHTFISAESTGHKTVIIVVGITSFLIIVLICVLVVYCIHRKLRLRKIIHIISNNSPGQQDNIEHRNSPNYEIEDDINAYEEIDEERMCPDSPNSRIDQTSSDSKSSSSSKTSKDSVNDGYINPYQALITDSKLKLNSDEVLEQEDKKKDEQQRNYSKLENNVISEKVEKTNNNQEQVIYLELEDTNNENIKPVVESESGDKNEDAIIRPVEWTFKRLNTM